MRTKLFLHCFYVMGPKTFNLPRSLLHPDRPGNKTYGDIVELLKGHFSPKPLVIAERFNQEEGESVTMFAAALKIVSLMQQQTLSLILPLPDLSCGI